MAHDAVVAGADADRMTHTPVCDLVLLSWNHLEETQPCLETLFETTDVPCRLFLVDNASEPEVRAFLAGVRPRGAIIEVRLLQNETNEGFPRGMNRGIAASSAPYVCLLNNDLRFTRGWLRELIDVAAANPGVGLINPRSSTFGDRPRPGQSLEAYADELRRFRHQYREVGMCIGFCLLIKRQVIDRTGGLSTEIERAFFEDEDYACRVQQLGYQCAVASGAYVYHAEHVSVSGVPEREALFTKNQRWCNEKWGRRIRIAWPRLTAVQPGAADLRRWLGQLVAWARRRAHVYAYCPMPADLDGDALFRSVGMIPHADIHWCRLPPVGARLAAAAWILLRRKKPFDVITSPDASWARVMARMRPLHRAEVVMQSDEAQLLATWTRRARSPSSS